MKNSKLRKALMLVACAVLLVCLSVGATLAYLTDRQQVVNTFTVGKVEITLDEAKVGDDGKAPKHDDRVQKNDYHLLPGQTYDKDPTVTVLAKSEDCYVRIKVTVTGTNMLAQAFPKCAHVLNDVTYFDLQGMVGGYDDTQWEFVGNVPAVSNDAVTYEFRYIGEKCTDTTKPGVVPYATSDTVLDDLFETVIIPGETTSAQMAEINKDVTITIVADAIQATGFESADAAWAAFVAPAN